MNIDQTIINMKKIQNLNPFIIPMILLLLITGCKKTDNETVPTKSLLAVSAYDTVSKASRGIINPISSSAIAKKKALALIIPPSPIINIPQPVGGPPTVTTLAAVGIDFTFASLNGMVNAKDKLTTVTFEYSPVLAILGVNSFIFSVPGNPSAVSGHLNTSVTAILNGISSNTTYRFRIKAVNILGTFYSSQLLFTTRDRILGGDM